MDITPGGGGEGLYFPLMLTGIMNYDKFCQCTRLARFILLMDHLSGTNFHINWANNDSSSDNLSVYKNWQTDGSSVDTKLSG